jgi:hypothetical protein
MIYFDLDKSNIRQEIRSGENIRCIKSKSNDENWHTFSYR